MLRLSSSLFGSTNVYDTVTVELLTFRVNYVSDNVAVELLTFWVN